MTQETPTANENVFRVIAAMMFHPLTCARIIVRVIYFAFFLLALPHKVLHAIMFYHETSGPWRSNWSGYYCGTDHGNRGSPD